jgi:NAD+ diphosphatase
LARAAAQRDAQRRGEPGLVAALLAAPTTRVLAIGQGNVPVLPGGRLLYLTPGEAATLGAGDGALHVYLGSHQGTDYVGLLLDVGPGHGGRGGPGPLPPLPAIEGATWQELRQIGGELDDLDAGLFTELAALEHWHRAARFCPACGAATQIVQAGWARYCPQDKRDLFPRTDPAVIMAVLDPQDRLLLVHAFAWGANRHSLVAGFTEAGESLEATVRRETLEETGIEVGEVRYIGSQPWPFPRSLMCAFEARALTTEIKVDGVEIECAHWFSRADFDAALADGSIVLPPGASIARAVIEHWRGGPVQEPAWGAM